MTFVIGVVTDSSEKASVHGDKVTCYSLEGDRKSVDYASKSVKQRWAWYVHFRPPPTQADTRLGQPSSLPGLLLTRTGSNRWHTCVRRSGAES